jgi:hypothetical protein
MISMRNGSFGCHLSFLGFYILPWTTGPLLLTVTKRDFAHTFPARMPKP